MASTDVSDVPIPLRAVTENAALALDVVAETVPPGALDRPVRWAHVSELRDPAPYLLGDELLLTAGVNLPDGGSEVGAYVRGLAAAGVSALGFGETPDLHDTLPGTLRAACAEAGMPLLVVPPRTPFLAVSRAVTLAVAEAAGRDRRRIAAARETLTEAAAGGLGEVARGLARSLSGWVVLVGADGGIAATGGNPPPLPAAVDALLARLRSGGGVRSATTELAVGTVVLAQPVYPQATASHLLVVGRPDRFDAADRAVVSVGAALLGLLGRSGEREENTAAIATRALLTGASPADPAAVALLGEGHCLLLAASREPGRAADREASGPGWLRARLGTPLVRVDGDECTAILREPPGEDVLAALRRRGWLAGVSAPVPVTGLAAAAAELPALRRRARALGRSVRSDADGLGLATVVDRDAAAGFAARTLAPLWEIDVERGGDLIPTLRAWLAQHGGWDRTAAALGVHRNSVRHRIRQVGTVLGVDLGDPEVRMELWFALRWDPGHRGVHIGHSQDPVAPWRRADSGSRRRGTPG
ncbi:PucR family transcriptional regulator [Amycolatopsis antarctica]|uniref:PucR family transcriptional regulator n=1 Tax=Amycolatopsis antarctica TaxID=1854586 RepID=A0A263CY29_9PSEU|nr:PucR family transcriptional regulator [Amycolatopsis antarctica]OZM71053.1 PucR family transcriptional regulator [Amycolatopsis antarctica]